MKQSLFPYFHFMNDIDWKELQEDEQQWEAYREAESYKLTLEEQFARCLNS